MAYSGSKISTGRVGEDYSKVRDNLGKLFGESPVLRDRGSKPLNISPLEGAVMSEEFYEED